MSIVRREETLIINEIYYPSNVVNIPSVKGKAFFAPISTFSIFLIDSLLLLSEVLFKPTQSKLINYRKMALKLAESIQ
jgi:hypothetical protein